MIYTIPAILVKAYRDFTEKYIGKLPFTNIGKIVMIEKEHQNTDRLRLK